MPPEHILPVLYDLTLTIGNETRPKPLLTRFLQRLLYHTSFPAGVFLFLPEMVDAAEGIMEARIGAVVGDYELLEREGENIRLPATLLLGDTARVSNAGALLKDLGGARYSAFLRLPVRGTGVILLLAQIMPETELPLIQMFQPILARLATAYRLCQESERRTQEMLEASRDLEAQRQLMTSVYDSLHVAVMITDSGGRIIATNPAFSRITGYGHDEIAGANPRILASGRHDGEFYRDMWAGIVKHGHWQGEIWNRRKGGEVYPEWLSITRMSDEVSGVTHYVGIFSDISEQKAAQEKIQYMAHYDHLTGLPNRVLLQDRFEQAVAHARRNNEQVAFLFLDLDNFKYINDVFGHATGDRVLCMVSQRLRDWLRVTDVLSRHGGDEFIVLLTGVRTTGAVALAAEKIVQMLREPFELDGNPFHIGVSIGISMFPQDGEDFDNLLRQSDMAMYHAKSSGRNAFYFYTQSMNQLMRERIELEQRLRDALATGAFELHYQPQVEFASGHIVGVEALLRWPGSGMSPARFIPTAEESGLIIPLGEWVLQEACRRAQRWYLAGGRRISVAVNLSAVRLRRGRVVDAVRDALQASGLLPAFLELELTESMLIDDVEITLEMVRALKALGVRLSLDDFGTGYSNLSYLQRLKVDKLKIDQSFVRNVAVDEEAAAIVRAIVEMGRSLGLEITAEGVETEEQARFLDALGCHYGQGYYFGVPLSQQDLGDLLAGSGGVIGHTWRTADA
jgi:diguanylate cyclase (GGDEF)-like protein/PAS domain S-box-containing protein